MGSQGTSGLAGKRRRVRGRTPAGKGRKVNCLVTGGAGFIGSNLVEALVEAGHHVRVLDNLSNGDEKNLEPFAGRVEFVRGDVRDRRTVARAVEGVEVVFHLAALGSVVRSVEDPAASNDVNVAGTLEVLLAARDAGVRRVVYSSSSSVYGDNPALPKREDLATSPISPYAVSKLAGEQYARVFYRVYGLETVCLRYFNVFGPRQRPDSPYAAVIPRFMRAALAGEPLVVFGDGRQSRDFTYVENVVRANLLAAQAPGVAGEVFNVACGRRITLLEIIETLERITGRRLERRHEAPRVGDVRHSEADVSAAAARLGYRVEVSFEEGLRRTWKAFRARYAAL
ncbi:MAG: SDR family oxidoreductase [Candidatus Dadabacteria bacterium]|nr:MAG: SDR family oxidoreductase [Candidatus Dadabacteria bacterium]